MEKRKKAKILDERDDFEFIVIYALKECGGNVRLAIYPDAENDSWTETYENPELYRWFLDHVK